MPKIKLKRKNISLDMTAMCDMAFLLLTFFILTSKFKPEESVVVDTPSSVAEEKVPESNIMTISIDKDGRVFFGIEEQSDRIKLLDLMAEKYGLSFSDTEKKRFALLTSFGMPMGGLKKFLGLDKTEQTEVKQPGIPAYKNKNELYDWVIYSRAINPKSQIAIKGDKETLHSVTERVITTLQEQNATKFSLITTLELRPKNI